MVFTLIEALFVAAALSMQVFLIAEYEGSTLRILNRKRVSLISLIFFLGQMISMGAGYMVTQIPFFRNTVSIDVKKLCYVLAAFLFLIVGGYLLYKAMRGRPGEERLREFRYKRIVLEALAVAVLTFMAGIACGFLGANPVYTFIPVAFITIAAVISGLYTGYIQGFRFRTIGYGVSSAVFLVTGIEVLVRYI